MVLESLESETPNIKDLSVEAIGTEEKNMSMKIYETINREDIEKMKEAFNQSIQNGNLSSAEIIALNLKYLSPSTELPRGVMLTELKQQIEILHSSKLSEGLPFILRDLKIIYPDEFESINISPEDWEKITNRFNERKENWDDVINFILAVKMVSAERFEQLVFDKSVYSKAKDDLAKRLRLFTNLDDESEKMAALKILSPELFEQLPFPIERWRDYQEVMDKPRKDPSWGWVAFSKLAGSIKFIAAKQVNFTEQGIEFIMPDHEFNQPPPPLPNQRSF